MATRFNARGLDGLSLLLRVISSFCSTITLASLRMLQYPSEPFFRRYAVSTDSMTSLPSVKALTSTPSSVPQSNSLTMTLWETSTSLLVRYPESAVRSAVSARPFLRSVGGNEVFQNGKSLTEVGLDRDFYGFTGRVGHQTTHTADLADLVFAASRSGVSHDKQVVQGSQRIHQRVGHIVCRLVPDLDNFLITFLVGYQDPCGTLFRIYQPSSRIPR